jgi:hypothetical protein
MPFTPNFEDFFQLLYIRESAVFLKVKRSNKIETVQYLKKNLFYKLVLGFKGQTKIT